MDKKFKNILLIAMLILTISLVYLTVHTIYKEEIKYSLCQEGGTCTMVCLGGNREYYCGKNNPQQFKLKELNENEECIKLEKFECIK